MWIHYCLALPTKRTAGQLVGVDTERCGHCYKTLAEKQAESKPPLVSRLKKQQPDPPSSEIQEESQRA